MNILLPCSEVTLLNDGAPQLTTVWGGETVPSQLTVPPAFMVVSGVPLASSFHISVLGWVPGALLTVAVMAAPPPPGGMPPPPGAGASHGTPTGRGRANSPPLTTSSEPIIPASMCPRTWQCICHSPTAGDARMKPLPS